MIFFFLVFIPLFLGNFNMYFYILLCLFKYFSMESALLFSDPKLLLLIHTLIFCLFWIKILPDSMHRTDFIKYFLFLDLCIRSSYHYVTRKRTMKDYHSTFMVDMLGTLGMCLSLFKSAICEWTFHYPRFFISTIRIYGMNPISLFYPVEKQHHTVMHDIQNVT